MHIKTLTLLFAVALATTATADESTPTHSRKAGPERQVEIAKLLERCDRGGELPKNVVVRVESDLRQQHEEKHFEFQEAWEFTHTHVHRIVRETKNGTLTHRRVESRPFRSRRLCQDLANVDVIAIRNNKGPGDPVNFARTDFEEGMRTFSIMVDGKTKLQLAESCAYAGYKEPHAVAFAALYEKVASQARAAFADEWAQDVLKAQRVLAEAAQTRMWPKSMVVRLGADVHLRGRGTLSEDWEFTESEVHRIRWEKDESGKLTRRRERTIMHDTRAICQELVDGRVFEIYLNDSPEDGLLLADYDNALGGRYMEVLLDGKEILELHEHCTGGRFGVTDAHSFAILYESLASRARTTFSVSKKELIQESH